MGELKEDQDSMVATEIENAEEKKSYGEDGDEADQGEKSQENTRSFPRIPLRRISVNGPRQSNFKDAKQKRYRKRYRKRSRNKSLIPAGGELQERLQNLLAPDAREMALASLQLNGEEATSFLANRIGPAMESSERKRLLLSDDEENPSSSLNLEEFLDPEQGSWNNSIRKYSPNSQASDGIEILLRASQE